MGILDFNRVCTKCVRLRRPTRPQQLVGQRVEDGAALSNKWIHPKKGLNLHPVFMPAAWQETVACGSYTASCEMRDSRRRGAGG